MQDVFIAGYSDKFSARPGETITFAVSSKAMSDFTATLHRSISADPNPKGPGIIEEDASKYFKPTSFASRYQGFTPGSFAQSTLDLQANIKSDLVIKLWFLPTVLLARNQTLLSWGDISISLDQHGIITTRLKTDILLSSLVAVKVHNWYSLEIKLSAPGNTALDLQHIANRKTCLVSTIDSDRSIEISRLFPLSLKAPIRIAASFRDPPSCFNGKIEAPEILADGKLIAKWDFSRGISSLSVKTKTGPDLLLKNAPTRGVTGRKWDATEFCWRYKPDHYAGSTLVVLTSWTIDVSGMCR